MKNKLLILLSFIITFSLFYLFFSFMIPGWRIKLDAPPLVYFIQQLRSMMVLKCGISLICAAVVSLGVSHVTSK
ncbi:MAG: hypothetical protein IKU13_06920 [Clostridia bacterium]|nr:hypothetical protein [Clostridia bacterium]